MKERFNDAIGKLYRLEGLLRAAILAEENDSCCAFNDGNGVTDVLIVALGLAGEILNVSELTIKALPRDSSVKS